MFTPAKQPNDDTENWPQPPSFDRNAPIQYPRKFEPTYLMKRFRGKSVSHDSISAPFLTSRGNAPDFDMLAQTTQNKKNNYSQDNPFLLDVGANPFSPAAPSFFDKNKDNVEQNSIPRPCNVPKAQPPWETLSLDEQKEIYYDSKEEFVEYMHDTFPLRLDFIIDEKCNEQWEAYERCLRIKEMPMGGFRWSTARAGLGSIYYCAEKQHDYTKCLDSVSRAEQERELRTGDEKTLSRLFPR
mmetsp:Transcript_7610/g.11814  ORF Transcript_7610/g.11814 Transcript_7610/m.11814 type:complete len:241 (-) Transcript_7610:116-838(-)